MFACIYVHISIYIYVYMCKYVYTCIHTYIHIYVCKYTYTNIHIHLPMYIYIMYTAIATPNGARCFEELSTASCTEQAFIRDDNARQGVAAGIAQTFNAGLSG